MSNNLNYNKFMFFTITITSTLFAISSNSWINCWMGLEINLVAFIYLMNLNNNLLSQKASITYFLTQSIGSMNLLFSIMIFYLNQKLSISYLIMNISLLLKMGGAPFHFWYPNVAMNLSWINCMILFTWQKISPMILLSYNLNYPLILISILCSALIGMIGGLNQTNLIKLLSYSSINHMSWILINLIINLNMWKLYFTIYSFMNMIIILKMSLLNIKCMIQLYNFKMNNLIKMLIMMNFLSLAGLPPFLGFVPKWMTIKMMFFLNFKLTILIMLLCSLITIYYYINLTYNTTLTFNYNLIYSQNNFKLNNKTLLMPSLMLLSTNFISLFYIYL